MLKAELKQQLTVEGAHVPRPVPYPVVTVGVPNPRARTVLNRSYGIKARLHLTVKPPG